MMRFLLCVVTTIAVLLSGCAKQSDVSSTTQTAYMGYYNAIEENDKYIYRSQYYTVSGELARLSDGTYRYYIFVDNPQIAMYDIVLLAIENNQPHTSNDKMMPNIGIFGDSKYSMIPYQSNISRNYVKGLMISGETDDNSIDISLLVEWKDKTKENVTREFLQFTIDQSGYHSSDIRPEELEESEEIVNEEDGEAVND